MEQHIRYFTQGLLLDTTACGLLSLCSCSSQTGETQISSVDFNGTQAVAADGSAYVMGTNKFVDDVITSYNYIVENGADPRNIMQTIATSSTVIGVQKISNNDDTYDPKKNTILWDPKGGYHITMEDKEFGPNTSPVDGYQSAAIGLVNESMDAFLDEFMPKEQQKAEEMKNQDDRDQWGIDRENEAIDVLNNKGFKETKRGNADTRGIDEQCRPCEEVDMTGPTSTNPK